MKDHVDIGHLMKYHAFRVNKDRVGPPTDPLLTPLLTPYKINGKMKIKKPRTINGTRFKWVSTKH